MMAYEIESSLEETKENKQHTGGRGFCKWCNEGIEAVLWVMFQNVVGVYFSWKGLFERHRSSSIWKTGPSLPYVNSIEKDE